MCAGGFYTKWNLLICSFSTSVYLSLTFCLHSNLCFKLSVTLALSAASAFWGYWHPLLLWDFFYFHRKRNNSAKKSSAQNQKVVIMSWLINRLFDIKISEMREREREGGRWSWRKTNLAAHSLPKLIRKTFYHEIWSAVLKAVVNVCLYPQCVLA